VWEEATRSQVPSTAIPAAQENSPLLAKTSAHVRSTWCCGSDVFKKASSSLQGQVMFLETWGWRCRGGGGWRRGGCSWLVALPAIEGDTSEGLLATHTGAGTNLRDYGQG